jgi:hypothetical protein
MTTAAEPAKQQTQAPAPSFQIIKGKTAQSWMVLLYGVPGIGKSTLAAMAPKPFFLDLEDGLARVDCERTPVLKTWAEFVSAVQWFRTSDYKTLVIDTADAVEGFLSTKILAENNKYKTLADFGFGRGYEVLEFEWGQVLRGLLDIKASGKNIIIIGHEKVEKFEDPTSENYDRFVLRVHKKAAALLTAKVDAVLFARWETFVKEKETSDKMRAVGTGKRLLYTSESPAFSAKNRFNLAPVMPMDKTIFDHLN